MEITDELRHYIEGAEQLYGRGCPRLTAMCDRIDAAHKKAMDDSCRDGYQEGKRDGDDEWYEEHEAYLEEHGWYQALDADKEPIKFGDEVEWRHPCGSCELRHGIVVGIKTDKIGDEMFHEITVKVDRFTTRLMANQLRHHTHSVEDVLREFALRVAGKECMTVRPDVITEYAAKLRLAGDAE